MVPKPKQTETESETHSLAVDYGLVEVNDEPLDTLHDTVASMTSKVETTCSPRTNNSNNDKMLSTLKRGPNQVLQLSEEDVEINYRKPLGSGGFCKVYPVTLTANTTVAAAYGAQHQQHHTLALKRLRLDILQDENLCKIAAADLMQEAKLLKDLAHENIIDLYGVRKTKEDTVQQEEISNDNGDITEKENTAPTMTMTSTTTAMDPSSFFMVLDGLSDTLESRCENWQKERGVFKQFTPQDSVMSRIRDNVLGIVKGMEYLHSKHIIFRDLKPDNVGFDSNNCVKIFDFGLAVKLNLNQDGKCRELRAGTLRYMAPEVAAGNQQSYYTISADVYSFAILLWQIVASRIPFETDISSFSGPTHLPKDLRPPLKYVESKDVQSLLESTWSLAPDERPSFATIGMKLEAILEVAAAAATTTTTASKNYYLDYIVSFLPFGY